MCNGVCDGVFSGVFGDVFGGVFGDVFGGVFGGGCGGYVEVCTACWLLLYCCGCNIEFTPHIHQPPQIHYPTPPPHTPTPTPPPNTHRLREQYPTVTCVALACPGCMTLELAQSCAGYVTTVVNGTDLVPTMSPAAADALREEVMQSAWYVGFGVGGYVGLCV